MNDYENSTTRLNDPDDVLHCLKLCRLCGKKNENGNEFVLINKYESSFIRTLKKCFSMKVTKTNFHDPNYQICIICKMYVQSLSVFCDHVQRVQQMIEVINNLSIENIKFELDEIQRSYRTYAPNMKLYLIENLKELTFKQNEKQVSELNHIKENEYVDIESLSNSSSDLNLFSETESLHKDFDSNADENESNDLKVTDLKKNFSNELRDERNNALVFSSNIMDLENNMSFYDSDKLKFENEIEFKKIYSDYDYENDIDLSYHEDDSDKYEGDPNDNKSDCYNVSDDFNLKGENQFENYNDNSYENDTDFFCKEEYMTDIYDSDSNDKNDCHDVNDDFIVKDEKQSKNAEKSETKKTIQIKSSKPRKYYPHSSKKFECEICLKKCFGARNLFKHKFKIHNLIPPEKKLNQEEAKKNLKYCEMCDQIFYHEYILTAHYEKCHNIKREIICDYCGVKFNTTIKLNFHLRKHLSKEELLKISEFKCSYCQKKFLNKTSLSIHIKGNHEISKDYICEICGKSFTCANYLSSHRRHEHVDNPTECPICKKNFKNYSHMKCHQHIVHTRNKKSSSEENLSFKKHTKKEFYDCPYCQKKFKTFKALNIHMIIHTNCKPFKCKTCGKNFTSPSNCKKHVKIIHRVQSSDNCYTGKIPTIAEINSMIEARENRKIEETDSHFDSTEYEISEELMANGIIEEMIP